MLMKQTFVIQKVIVNHTENTVTYEDLFTNKPPYRLLACSSQDGALNTIENLLNKQCNFNNIYRIDIRYTSE